MSSGVVAISHEEAFTAFVTQIAEIASDPKIRELAKKYLLACVRVMWEDSARTPGSCWGPNISDMTLIVKNRQSLMSVFRPPNFSDTTHDVPIDQFNLNVGNVSGFEGIVPLSEYLKNAGKYCRNDDIGSLFCEERDSVVLTSTQCCVLPCQGEGETQFAVQLFNYQSYDEDPAVLVILVSKDGVSTQVVGNENQKLFFNNDGRACWFKIERLGDVRKRRGEDTEGKAVERFSEMSAAERMENCLMVIQVPLKVKPRAPMFTQFLCEDSSSAFTGAMVEPCSFERPVYRGLDMGVISRGDEEGVFEGTKGLALERDERFPIRCTFQNYVVTDVPEISEDMMREIADQLKRVESVSLASGSLVTDGERSKERVTAPDLSHPVPSDTPFGKLDKRDYLEGVAPEEIVSEEIAARDVWKGEKMAGFM